MQGRNPQSVLSESDGENDVIRRLSGSSEEEEKKDGPYEHEEDKVQKTRSIVSASKRNLMHELEYIQTVSHGMNIRMSVSFNAFAKNVKKMEANQPPPSGVRFKESSATGNLGESDL